MHVTRFFSLQGSELSISERQGSTFAKSVAGDFNPLHDEGNKRFCVPGDLLFSILLHHYGVHARTSVQFAGMLGAGDVLKLPALANGCVHLADARERHCLSLFVAGGLCDDDQFAAALATAYVRFSGQTFPDILVELMRKAGVMINAERPLVIYKDMTLRLSRMQGERLRLVPLAHEFSASGKKGTVRLRFTIEADGQPIGEGEKNMVLSGLRPFEEQVMADLVARYDATRKTWQEPSV